MVSVIIAHRNEKYLRQTIRSIEKSCGRVRPEVLVVCDGSQDTATDVPKWVRVETPWQTARGCQAARDWGILNAEHDHCVVIDGHMDFDRGLFSAYHDHLADSPQDVLCAHTPGLDPEKWERQEHTCSGAYVLWADGGKTALSLKWRYSYDTGEVPAVLGACYGLSREWYVDGLQRPWQYGTGWGCDEETISITNWLCGGRNIVMPFDAAHWFRVQKQVPYPVDAFMLGGIIANRLRLISMIPMAEAWRRELEGAVHAGTDGHMERPIRQLLERHDVSDYRAWLEMQSRTFADWRRLWCSDVNPHEHPETMPPGIRVTIQERHEECYASASPPSPPQSQPAAETPAARKKPEQNIVVLDWGVPCPHCRERYGHRVSHTYPNGNRRRICSGCGRPFVTLRPADDELERAEKAHAGAIGNMPVRN